VRAAQAPDQMGAISESTRTSSPLTLTWTAPTSDGGSAITAYSLE